LINASVLGIAAQRIIRKNCPHCSDEDQLSEPILKEYELYEISNRFKSLLNGGIRFRRGRGCAKCAGTGYRDRTAIFEIFDYTDELKETFIRGKSLEGIRTVLRKQGSFRNLRQDGMLKVLKGLTTVEEVLRIS